MFRYSPALDTLFKSKFDGAGMFGNVSSPPSEVSANAKGSKYEGYSIDSQGEKGIYLQAASLSWAPYVFSAGVIKESRVLIFRASGSLAGESMRIIVRDSARGLALSNGKEYAVRARESRDKVARGDARRVAFAKHRFT